MSDADIIVAFEQYLKNDKCASANTLSSYIRDIKQLSDYLNENKKTISTASESDLESYIEKLRSSGKSIATVSRCIASIKNMYSNLCIKQILKNNPSLKLVPDKNVQKLPEILTPDEALQLLMQPKCIDAKGYRDKAMLELLYCTGIRVTELIDLNIDDFKLDSIICSSKGKERKIKLSNDAIKYLNDYLTFVRPQMVTNQLEPALFVNVSGERMSRQGFWKIIKYYAKKANIKKDITPHTLRHSFATYLMKSGTDIHSIQEILGHADISSTHIYANIVKNHSIA